MSDNQESILDKDVFSEDANLKFANQDLQRVISLVERLDHRLKNDEPDIANLCGLIHQDLISNPELAYMLTEDQCKIVVAGHVKHMNAEIVKAATKKKSSRAEMRSVSADDL